LHRPAIRKRLVLATEGGANVEDWERKVAVVGVAAALFGAVVGAGAAILLIDNGPTGPQGEQGRAGPRGPAGDASAAVADVQATAEDLDGRVSELESSAGSGVSVDDLDLRVSDLESRIDSLCLDSGC
jgi:hypothetical protein